MVLNQKCNIAEPSRCPGMGEPEGKQGAAFPSEASRMLEAALEQMDGIIQGAKYELPHYFDNFSIQVVSVCHRVAISRDPNVFLFFRKGLTTDERGGRGCEETEGSDPGGRQQGPTCTGLHTNL